MLKKITVFFAVTLTTLFGQDFVPFPIAYDKILQTVAPILGDSPTIFEAGAFDGSDTVILAETWPTGHIFSFEPVPFLYEEALKKTKSKDNVILTNKALSNSIRKEIFYLAEASGQPFQSSSLDEPYLHKEAFPWVAFNRTIHVHTTTIDRIAKKYKLDNIDFFWLDTEGHELPILQAYSKLEETKAIYCEVAFIELRKNQALFGELTDFLASKGFIVVGVNFDYELLEGKVIPKTNAPFGDALYIHESLLDNFR